MYAIEEIKKDVEEFTKIAIEDKISRLRSTMFSIQINQVSLTIWSTEKLLEKLKEYSDREIAASEIIG